MAKWTVSFLLLVALAFPQAVMAGQVGGAGSLLALARQTAVDDEEEPTTLPVGDGPPLPLHTIEGVGGGLIVPEAYLVNPGPPGTVVGKPSTSVSFLVLGRKNLLSIATTETLFRRVEIGYCFNRIGLGSLPKAIRKAGLNIDRHEIYLHHFNIRGLIIEENSFDLPLPAIVIGAQFKYNATIQDLDDQASHALRSIGLDKANGVDWTLHMTKMFPTLAFGRPLVVTVGMRNSRASNAGITGFGTECNTTVEADVACLVTDRVAVGYEFRQNDNPFDVAPGVMEDQDDWHAIRAAYIVNDQLALAAGWAYLGPLGNGWVKCAWGVQVKYEF